VNYTATPTPPDPIEGFLELWIKLAHVIEQHEQDRGKPYTQKETAQLLLVIHQIEKVPIRGSLTAYMLGPVLRKKDGTFEYTGTHGEKEDES